MRIVQQLYNMSEKAGNKAAFIDQKETVTYADLLNRAESIGSFLSERIGENQPVMVLIDRNAACICAFFGIIASHNFYVPVSIQQPAERIRTIISEIRPAAIITVFNTLPDGIHTGNSLVAGYEEICSWPVNSELLMQRKNRILDIDPLYAMCTSGTTGKPKVVLIPHRGVLDFIPVFTDTFHFDSEEVFGNQAPFDFDVSVKDIYAALFLGATMYIIPQECFVMPKKIGEVLDDNKVTAIIWAVSALCIAAGFHVFKHRLPGSLRKILFSGETMPVKMLNILREYFPDAMFVNLYGPTEITCNCMYYIIDRQFQNDEKLPLGIPFMNEGILVLNDKDKPVSPGETGEICVKGSCLALGYYNNPEQTKKHFVQNPLNDLYLELIYRSGDMACLMENGEYVFAARKDTQIKHMGHRIELEEIEFHFNGVNNISRACCLYDEKKNKIIGMYSGDMTAEEIIPELKKKLPKYMLPNVYIRIDRIPLTKNGKIDRRELRNLYESGGLTPKVGN